MRGQAAIVDAIDFHWLNQRRWYQDAHGYAKCDLWGRRGGMKVLMHRLILLAPDTATVDHANQNKLDNRRANLRLATQSEQNANRAKFHGTSKYKGVSLRVDKLKWIAQITANGRPTIHLGSFGTEEDAARAYNDAARRLHGRFARLNVIEDAAKGVAAARPPRNEYNLNKTHCPHGHRYTKTNTIMEAGRRRCVICRREQARARYEKSKGT